MTDRDASLSQSRLDEAGVSPKPNVAVETSMRSSSSSQPPRPGLDVSGMDGNASIAFSDAASERPSKPRSTTAASQRPPSVTSARGGADGSRRTSNSNGGESGLPEKDDVGNASIAFSDAASDRASKPRASPAPSQRAPSVTSRTPSEANFAFGVEAERQPSIAGSERTSKPRISPAPSQRASYTSGRGADSRLASEANFGLADADDDGNASVAASDRPSKSRSSQAQAAAYRSPSLASGHGGSRLGAESSLGGSVAADDDDDSSVAPSDRPSKPRSATAASQRAPSVTSARGGGGGGGSESNMGFSGFSMPGKGADDDDDDASVAPSDHPSRAPSQRARAASIAASSRKPSEVNPGASFSADIDGNASIAFSDAASERRGKASSVAASRLASEAGGGRSARPSGLSGTSYDKDDEEAPVSTPPRRRSSFASSLRQSVASHKDAADSDGSEVDGEGEATAAVSLSQSRVGGDDAASTRSGVTTAASTKSRSKVGDPSVSGLSMRSGRSAAPSSTVKTASSSEAAKTADDGDDGYGDDSFDEEAAEDDSEGSASESVPVTSATSATSKRQGSRPLSASSRQSSRSGPPAAVASRGSGSGYSQEFDAPSNSGRQSPSVRGGDADASQHDGDGATSSSVARSASGAAANISASGSIFHGQPSDGTTPGSRRGGGGGSVFRRLPADAPDDVSTDGGDSRQQPQRTSSVRSGSLADGADGAEWNEGAVRVPGPGAPRPFNPRRSDAPEGGLNRPRPMSAAPRDRQSALVDGLTRKHPATWEPVDVATWVEFLGLGQYRRRFLHHCVDGRLLLQLTDSQLKSEMGIGPMGHRCAILDAAANLIKSYKEAQRDRVGRGEEDDDGRHEMQRSSTAPRARPRPSSAMPGALTLPPPGPRRPASASRSVIPPDPFLGPAMGKVTVYEQRAKLLFELDRAQARAEQHRALAEQLKYTATLSSDEVSHIRGLLVEIEKKNRAAFELSGGVDSGARIPWRHVGNGTKHNNWNPERFARPGDPETVDLTFQPRCANIESKKLMGGGEYGENSGAVNSFLDRLNNDLRKREQGRKELERRYHSDGAGNPLAGDSDMQLVSEHLQSRCHITLEADAGEYEVQIDEALDKLCTGESWREAGLRDGPIRAAKGTAKIAAMATALRSLSFMERYRSDLKAKNSRAKALEKKWINQTLGSQYLPGGKDKEDLDEAAKFFALLGWRDGDGNASDDAIDPDLLDRLLERALEYRKRFDAWWERVRDKPEERAAGYKCDINWFSHPWDADGLAGLMEQEMKRMGDGGRSQESLQPPGAPAPMDFVEFTVRLLGKCREDDLRRLVSLAPKPKRMAVYRAIRTQKFIEFTQKDLEERDRKLRQAYNSLAPSRRKIESTRIESFFERLVDDAAKRRAKAEKLAHDKVQKEKEILESSVMYGRARSAR